MTWRSVVRSPTRRAHSWNWSGTTASSRRRPRRISTLFRGGGEERYGEVRLLRLSLRLSRVLVSPSLSQSESCDEPEAQFFLFFFR